MGGLHLVQGLVLLILALTVETFREFTPTIVGLFFRTIGEDQYAPMMIAMFDLPVAVLASVFILLSATFHFLISVVFKKHYLAQIERGINSLRWYEYALSSSLMIVLLSTMFGVTSIDGILLVFGLNAVMNLLGLLMEKMNPPTREKTDWTAHIIGWIAGILPWIVIVIYMLNIGDLSLLPWFAIPGLLFYFFVFNLFAFNQIFQYARVGKWKNYVFGEKTYIWLSLIGKSTLAWLVFIGILLS
jgi:hypothetical protein